MSGVASARSEAPAPVAGLALTLAGEAVVCRPSGALWIEAHRTLVFADLHLEKASWFAERGQMLPPYDSADTLRRLAAEAAVLAPARLVLLGDSFHDAAGEARLGRAEAEALADLARRSDLIWVSGNHDPGGGGALGGQTVETLSLGALRLVHAPAPGPSPGEIAGHLHPCARVAGRGGTVRRRCFIAGGARMVLPAFGALAGGLNVRDAAYAPLFAARPRPVVGVLGAGAVHAVGWAALRGD